MPLALDQLRRDFAPIVRAIIADVRRQVAPAIVEARGVERLLLVIEGDERPRERMRRENASALLEMAALGDSRDAAMQVARRRSNDPNTRHNLAQRFRRLRRQSKRTGCT
jgi:hypothetical protein